MRRLLLLTVLTTAFTTFTHAAAGGSALDSITGPEIAATVAAVKASDQFVKGSLFAIVALAEPEKARVLSGEALPRRAFVVLMDRDHNRTSEITVNLRDRSIASWKDVAGVQPSVVLEEYVIAPEILRADARFIAAMKKRGIDDLDHVKIDAWAPGALGDHANGSRIVRAIFFHHDEKDSNWYSRPIEGVVALIDLTHRKVLEVTDTGIVPISTDRGSFDHRSVGQKRVTPKPLQISQPRGAGYLRNGHTVEWQNWKFHFGLDPREGLVLRQVSYKDGGRRRSILYRAALSEMVVPYGDPESNWNWRSAFDVGEYGIGRLASPIVKGIDVPENAELFDFAVATDEGQVQNLRDSVALYERDGGLLWKHYDIDRDYNESRRARQLVVSFIATVGNYDYALNWIFHQDGTLEQRSDLTGIMLTKGVAERLGSHDAHGGSHAHYVAPNLVAPHHQHFFNFRLDLDVDGTANSVVESNSRPLPEGADNALGNGFLMEATPLASELAARRDLDLAHQRKWKVVNPAERNALEEPTGYLLVAGDNSLPFILPGSPVRKRAGFVDHHFWATQFHEGEIHAAGYYPNQSAGGDGLAAWTANDESLDKKDLVVWYTTGVTHIPRPEEWPIMTVHQTGFKLMPAGFFVRNPALDVP